MPLRIYNTLTRKKEDFVPAARRARSGSTSAASRCTTTRHIGHARSAIVFDVMRRYLRFRGYQVKFVRNFTDVDDKIIRRANAEGVTAQEISERYIEAERDGHGLARRRCPPTSSPRPPSTSRR